MKKTDLLIILPIMILGFAVRTYHLNRPIADWHSWRQADTASVTRHFIDHGIDLLHPRYDDLSSIPSGLDNPQGYRMVEFPFINALQAIAYQSLPVQISLETFLRLTSIIASVISIFLLYLIVKSLASTTSATLAALVFTLAPFNIFYSSTVLPEVFLVTLSLASTAAWISHSLNPQIWKLLLFSAFLSLALLLKPTVLMLSPAWAFLYLRHQKTKLLLPSMLIPLLSLIPLLWWRNWILQFPSGIPAYDWLFNGTGIRFTGAFFRWLFAERLGKLILGYLATAFFIVGIATKPSNKSSYFFLLWLFGVLAYLFIFATGNVTHDYYQIITVPIIAIFTGIGIKTLVGTKSFNLFVSIPLTISTLLLSFAFSWYHIRDLYNINNPALIVAATFADQNLPASAKLIAPYGGDTAFLYNTNRPGWPIGGDIPSKISLGATHYLTLTNDDEARALSQSCPVLEHNDTFILLDLTQCQQLQ